MKKLIFIQLQFIVYKIGHQSSHIENYDKYNQMEHARAYCNRNEQNRIETNNTCPRKCLQTNLKCLPEQIF